MNKGRGRGVDPAAVVVIDMTQITMQDEDGPPLHPSDGKQRILDPATRLLDRGIKTALEGNNFNDIAAALIQGTPPPPPTSPSYSTLHTPPPPPNICYYYYYSYSYL